MIILKREDVLRAAIAGYQIKKTEIDQKIAELQQELGGATVEPQGPVVVPIQRKWKFTAAARRRMAAAQKKRWAAIRRQAA